MALRREENAYHNPRSKRANFFDGSRSSLLEAYAVDLGPVRFLIFSYSVFRPMLALLTPAIEAAGVGEPTIRGLHQTERTLLCRWMVYSRATTSSMALRPAPALPAAGLLDLGGIVGDVKEGRLLSLVAGKIMIFR